MLVFSDTSPISCLASLQRLDLLDAYGSVRITQAVKNELDAHPLVDALPISPRRWNEAGF